MSYFFRASSTEIPPYFSPPDVSCVSAVQAQLASVLNDALGLSVDAYSDKFGVTESDPVFGTF